MPELPEVETIKNDLKKRILKKKIVKVIILNNKILDKSSAKNIIGKEVKKIERIGKLIIITVGKKYLLIHLKMTGQLIFSKANNFKPDKHTHVIIEFQNKSRLYFRDVRRFGYLKVVNEKELLKEKAKYGAEPLTAEFNLSYLKTILKKRKAPIKSVLMNQKLIAGIGNIYADEILFHSQIKPTRIAGSLKEDEIKNLVKSANEVIRKAIKFRGTSISDFIDTSGTKGKYEKFLRVYGRKAGDKCFRCGEVIKKIKIAGRTTKYCMNCQK